MHSAYDGREVVVEQNDRCRLLGDVSPLDSHRNANVGLFQGRCIVDTIARHGDHFPGTLQRVDDPHLLFWRDASIDAHMANPALEFLRRKRSKLRARQQLRII